MISVWPTYASWAAGETTLSRTYARLEPARRLFERADTRLVTSAYGFDLCNYLSRGTASCTPVEMKTLEERMAGGSSFERALEREGATLFYADADTMGIPAIKRFVANPLSGWRVAAYQSVGLEKWALVEKSTSTALPEPDGPVDIVPSTGPVALGPGWYGFERYGEVTMRWVHNDAVIVFTDLPRASLSIDVEVGPGSSTPGPLKLSALVDDDAIGQIFELTGRKILTVDNLPVHGEHQLRLHADGEGKPLPTDARILRFRVFRIFVPAQ
jgi:hypothetical protein